MLRLFALGLATMFATGDAACPSADYIYEVPMPCTQDIHPGCFISGGSCCCSTITTDNGNRNFGRLVNRLRNGLRHDETPVQAVASTVEPKDGLLVYIYNSVHRYSRLADWGDCGFYNGEKDADQLWQLVEDKTLPGAYFLYNFVHDTDRYAYNPDYGDEGSFCWNGIKDDYQLWRFKKADNGYWLITSVANPDCRLANWDDQQGGGYCGGMEDDQYFRLEPAFDSTARWTIVDDLANHSSNPLKYTFKYTEGMSSTIQNTISMKESSKETLKESVKASVELLGNVDESAQMTVTTSFSESYQNSMSHTWSVERTLEYTIPPGTHICLKQLAVDNLDNSNGVSFTFSSKLTVVAEGAECGGYHEKAIKNTM